MGIIHFINYIIQIYSGITCSRVLNGELYAQILQKLIYLYLFTDCFMKVSLQSSEQITDYSWSIGTYSNLHQGGLSFCSPILLLLTIT